MKEYIAHFECLNEVNKIQLIKLLRIMTNLGLKDAKEFVETVIMPKLEYGPRFQLKLTETQLGRFLIDQTIRQSDACYAPHFELNTLDEVQTTHTDITKL